MSLDSRFQYDCAIRPGQWQITIFMVWSHAYIDEVDVLKHDIHYMMHLHIIRTRLDPFDSALTFPWMEHWFLTIRLPDRSFWWICWWLDRHLQRQEHICWHAMLFMLMQGSMMASYYTFLGYNWNAWAFLGSARTQFFTIERLVNEGSSVLTSCTLLTYEDFILAKSSSLKLIRSTGFLELAAKC